MHGKALRNKCKDDEAQCLDSGKFQYAKACNQVRKTLTINVSPAHSTSAIPRNKSPFA